MVCDVLSTIFDKIVREKGLDHLLDLDSKFAVPGEAAGFLLREVDNSGKGLSYRFIVLCVRVNFPKSRITVNYVRKIAREMAERGEVLPVRKFGSPKDWKPKILKGD